MDLAHIAFFVILRWAPSLKSSSKTSADENNGAHLAPPLATVEALSTHLIIISGYGISNEILTRLSTTDAKLALIETLG
jgi:hypothetical protein